MQISFISMTYIGASVRKLLSVAFLAVMLSGGMIGLMAVTSNQAEAVPRKVKRACKLDYKRLCPRYRSGTSRMRSCMRSHGGQLSWNCYQALKDYGYVRRSRGRKGRRRRR